MAQQQEQRHVYQIIDGEDLFTHGLYEDLESAKSEARRLAQNDHYFAKVQINRIPLNVIGPFSESFDYVWSIRDDDKKIVT